MTATDHFEGLHSDTTDRILKVFLSVSNELGYGFHESVYRRSLSIALRQAGMTAEEEVAIPVFFRNHSVGTFYADILVEGLVILELKAADEMSSSFQIQLLHYLRSTPIEVGLVLLFGKTPKVKRVVMTNDRKRNSLSRTSEL